MIYLISIDSVELPLICYHRRERHSRCFYQEITIVETKGKRLFRRIKNIMNVCLESDLHKGNRCLFFKCFYKQQNLLFVIQGNGIICLVVSIATVVQSTPTKVKKFSFLCVNLSIDSEQNLFATKVRYRSDGKYTLL